MTERIPEAQARFDLVAKAVSTITAINKQGDGILPSPLLPQKIADISELLPLEKLLLKTDEKGHLREIARSPRLDMHYQEEVIQVSRARRLASAADRHLSSHTACWQQRTISGIIPKSVLALYSEDDYTIYENRLFARLVDRLEKHLLMRLAQVQVLLSNFLEAQKFQTAPETYHRLYNDVCKIWGETFDDRQTSAQVEMSKQAVDMISKLLRGVRVLKQSDLYRAVPRDLQMPDQIHMTNILTHDQHYRHLVPLWERQREESANVQKTPEQRLASTREVFEAYVDYIGIVLQRTLRQLEIVTHGSHVVELVRKGNEWRLRKNDALDLVFLPFIECIDESLPSVRHNQEVRIPVFLEGDYSRFNPTSILLVDQNATAFVLTPLDFLVEEKMVTLLTVWKWQSLLGSYGREIFRVPSPITQYLSQLAQFEVIGSQVALIAPVHQSVVRKIETLFMQLQVSKELCNEFMSKIDGLELLITCQSCGKKTARFESRAHKSFRAFCEGCNLEWGIFTQEGQGRIGKLSANDNVNHEFALYGRRHIEFPL